MHRCLAAVNAAPPPHPTHPAAPRRVSSQAQLREEADAASRRRCMQALKRLVGGPSSYALLHQERKQVRHLGRQGGAGRVWQAGRV